MKSACMSSIKSKSFDECNTGIQIPKFKYYCFSNWNSEMGEVEKLERKLISHEQTWESVSRGERGGCIFEPIPLSRF